MGPVAEELNRGLSDGHRQLKATPVLKGIKEIPAFKQPDWIARLQGERLRGHIARAAQHGQTSDHAGLSPVPGLVRGADFGRRP